MNVRFCEDADELAVVEKALVFSRGYAMVDRSKLCVSWFGPGLSEVEGAAISALMTGGKAVLPDVGLMEACEAFVASVNASRAASGEDDLEELGVGDILNDVLHDPFWPETGISCNCWQLSENRDSEPFGFCQ